MKIDGKKIGATILKDLKKEVRKYKKKGITPTLAVILVGADPGSLSYVKQKGKAAAAIGAKMELFHFKKTPLYQDVVKKIKELDQNPEISGIIIQRPLPPTLSADELTTRISIKKDVDGFLPKSKHIPPLGVAMYHIFNQIYFKYIKKHKTPRDIFSKRVLEVLRNKNIVILGRGETGGKPIGDTLRKYQIDFVMLHSGVENKKEYLKDADIIISAVGKPNILKGATLKKDAWLIGVGVHKEQGILKGDYNDAVISKQVAFYTPTPGGVGPVNVACLLANVVAAVK